MYDTKRYLTLLLKLQEMLGKGQTEKAIKCLNVEVELVRLHLQAEDY